MSDFGVVLFHTTSAALRAEKMIRKAGFPGKLIPTPRQYSSDCGFALRFDWTLAERVREMLTGASVEIAGLHPLS